MVSHHYPEIHIMQIGVTKVSLHFFSRIAGILMSPPAEFNGIVLDFPHYILRCGFQICECFSAFLTLSIYIEKELEERYLHFSYWVIIYKH